MEATEYVRMVKDSDTAVLMIHGIVGSPAHFKDLLPLIPEEWSVCNLLLDGHGKGVREFGATSMIKWKMQVSARLEELLRNHPRVLMVAHSMGTLFAIRKAIENHEQIVGLFLLNIPMRVHLPPRTIAAALKNAFGKVKPEDRYGDENGVWSSVDPISVAVSFLDSKVCGIAAGNKQCPEAVAAVGGARAGISFAKR